MYNVLVLGATGFIGGHIAKKAQDVGWKVHGFRRNPSASGHLQNQGITWIEGDLKDPSSLRAAMSGMDFVFHAAGYVPPLDPREIETYKQIAAEQMENVTSAARIAGIRRLIYTSSLTTIGIPPSNQDRPADERDIYQTGTYPNNGYYEVKSVMENIALQKAADGDEIVVMNPTTVFGPGDTKLSTGLILVLIAQGKALAVPPGMINIIDVRDVAQAHINAARTGKKGERYILGGDNYSLMEAVSIIANLAGVRPPLFTISPWIIDQYIKLSDRLPFLPYPQNHLRAYRDWQPYNISKAVNELGLQSRFLEETIRDSLRWFTNQGVL
jgi:dihydroflavonol-4-reductase